MKTKARYIRVSHETQNEARQKVKKFDGTTYIDKCSGTIPFSERVKGKLLYESIESGKINYVECDSIDRLGRDADDIQSTIRLMKTKQCQLVVSEYGLMMFKSDGGYNEMFKLITDLLANLAEMERQKIHERQRQGVELAKAKGIYTGRKLGTAEDSEKFLKKYDQIVSIINVSNGKLTANAISKMVRGDDGKVLATPPTVRKIMGLVG